MLWYVCDCGRVGRAIRLACAGDPCACQRDTHLVGELTDDRTMTVTSLAVSPPLRGRGVALALMRRMALHCVAHGVRLIELDDMSARRHSLRNVYRRAGMWHRRAQHPEMYGSPKRVARLTSTAARIDNYIPT